MKLTKSDAELLAILYEMPHWQVFRKKFLEERQLELTMQAPFATNMDRVAELRGMIINCREIETDMAKLHKKQDKS